MQYKHIKGLFFFIFCFVIFSARGQAVSYKDLVGKWQGTDEKNEKGSLRFIDSSKIAVSMMSGPELEMNYKIDFSKDPMWLDLYRKDAPTQIMLKGLIRLNSKNELKWQVFPDGKRPADFMIDRSGTSLILQRVQ